MGGGWGALNFCLGGDRTGRSSELVGCCNFIKSRGLGNCWDEFVVTRTEILSKI